MIHGVDLRRRLNGAELLLFVRDFVQRVVGISVDQWSGFGRPYVLKVKVMDVPLGQSVDV